MAGVLQKVTPKMPRKMPRKCLRIAATVPPQFSSFLVNLSPPAIEFEAAATPTPPRPRLRRRGDAAAATPIRYGGSRPRLRHHRSLLGPPRPRPHSRGSVYPLRPTAATPTLPRGYAPGSAVPAPYINEHELILVSVALDTCL